MNVQLSEPSEPGAGRYAPSPSGDLHLGNLRTALIAWLFARSTGRRFFIRIEDVDRGRDAGAAHQQLQDLSALGIDWDGDVLVQTERRSAHEDAISHLQTLGLVYECTCTRREILEAPSAPHAVAGAYPGTCRDRTNAERDLARKRIAPRKPALRLRATDIAQSLTFEDLLLGTQSAEIDDFVIQRGDGAIAYNLAVVVDDAYMQIDQVVRGADLVSSTPRQVLLQQLLGLSTPKYAHVPLVLGPTGKRLAKRDGAVTMRDLAAVGVGPEQVRSMLCVSLGLADPHESVNLTNVIDRFVPERLPKDPWTFTS